VSRPAPFVDAVRSQAAMELRLTARRGENLLAMIGIPAVLLAYFATFALEPQATAGTTDAVGGLLPGTLTLALVASGLVNLGIATAYERGYGVLKRLGGAPLGRSGLISAKLAVVVGIALVQVVGLLALAFVVLHWQPSENIWWPGVGAAAIVGSLAFAGLGLLLAGTLRPEATLVVANALFVAAILLGGVLPIASFTGAFGAAVALLPIGALREVFDAALHGGTDLLRPLALLGAWAVVAFAAAARSFRWE
jgi:ABC-2 type transport system permease protein